VLACVALAAVLMVSGVAKLLDRSATREAVAGFGVPTRLVPVVATVLAPTEIAVALLVLVPATAAVGLLLAVALLVAFTATVVLALRAGRRPECHCFGRIGGADVSGRTVARNGVLILIAVLGLAGVATDDRPSGSGLLLAVLGGLVLAAALVAAEGLAGRAARARRAAADEAAYDRVERVVAPDFRLPDLGGGETSLSDLLAPGFPVLLVSLSPGCGPCKRLRPDVARWAQLLDSRLTVAVLATGNVESNRSSYHEVPHLTVLADEDGEARRGLGTTATPSAVIVGADRVLTSGVAGGEPLVRRLLVSLLTGVEPVETEAEIDEWEGTPVDELDLTSVVAPRETVQLHRLADSTVLLDTATGATVVLDHIGALVWSVLDGTATLAEIVADLAAVYGAPVEQVGADVLALARTLGQAGLLAGVAPDPHAGHGHVHPHPEEPEPALTPDHAGA
jgi:thiol-disulfide isomerase/thioredoxin